jgi:sugar phosphate isomerase/epimerase
MLRAMSTYIFVKERLHPGMLDMLVRGGAQAIEIFASRSHMDYANRKRDVLEIAAWFRDSGVPLNSVHSPMFADYDWGRSGGPPVNIASTDKARRIEAMDEIKRAIEIAEQVPFRFLIQHMGTPTEDFDEQKVEACMTSVEHLRAFAKPLGVRLLLENIPNELSTPQRLVQFIRAAHFEDVGICLDLGHAHIMSSVVDAFDTLKEHIRSTHVHDNGRDRDAHMWPGEGSIDWDEAMRLLRSAPHTPPVLMEINGEGKTNIVEGMTDAFRKLESAGAVAAPK